MITATLPGQMFDHMCNADKGWPHPAAVDFTAPISDSLLYPLLAGQCGHLNSAGKFEPGCVAWQMPLFCFQGANSLDVNNANNGQWYPISPTGKVMCFVGGKSAVEMWTTEFDTAQTYAINQPLRAPTGLAANQAGISGTLTNQGVLTWVDYITSNANLPTAIVGIVSKGVFTNAYGKRVLGFWPVWFPGHPSQTV